MKNTFEERQRERNPGYCTGFVNLVHITENTSRTFLCVCFCFISFILNSPSWYDKCSNEMQGVLGKRRSKVLWTPERIITMTAPNKSGETQNYRLSNLLLFGSLI
jgi:hypothetical protein